MNPTASPRSIPTHSIWFQTVLSLMVVLLSGRAVQSWAADSAQSPRTNRGVVVLYDFSEGSGAVIHDHSGVGTPVNLQIEDSKAVRWTNGGLQLIKATQLTVAHKSGQHLSDKINQAIRRSSELSVEVWIQPAKVDQKGPARIVTLSQNSVLRNVTLGQEGDRYDVRLRSSKTSTNGLPSLSSPAKQVKTKLTHLVYTRSKSGNARLFVNGRQVSDTKVGGSLGNWDGKFALALGNEFSGQREWLGTYQLVAIYSRAISDKEIQAHFRAGPNSSSTSTITKLTASEELFEHQIARLLSNHCLECHDASTQQGGLDLSRKQFAMAGGDSGKAIIAAKSADSLLWQSVRDDEMPHDRPALSDDEKQSLKKWIDSGAEWPFDVVDPVLYLGSQKQAQHWVQRLTTDEYVSAVKTTIGVDIADEAKRRLPTDKRADGFSNTAYNRRRATGKRILWRLPQQI